MNYKNYALLLLPILLAGFLVVKNNSQQSLIASENNENIEIKNNFEDNKKIPASQTKSDNTNPTIAIDSNETSISNQSIETQNTSMAEPEPSNENSDMTATGEFADEVNLKNSADNCEDSCDGENTETAGSENVNATATGEFADQINKDAIFAQAQQKNAELQPEVKLGDPSEGAPPTTEIGAYTPPQ